MGKTVTQGPVPPCPPAPVGFGCRMIQVSRRRFREMAENAWLAVPEELRVRVDNLHIVIEDEPSPQDYALNEVPEDEDLFGLFEGHALTDSSVDGGGVLPNTIRIFQFPHEEVCDTEEELEAEVTRTMHHELAHHFGIDDDYLEAIGAY
jgi:predicted Zn-dependent protease with MMP-like domain